MFPAHDSVYIKMRANTPPQKLDRNKKYSCGKNAVITTAAELLNPNSKYSWICKWIFLTAAASRPKTATAATYHCNEYPWKSKDHIWCYILISCNKEILALMPKACSWKLHLLKVEYMHKSASSVIITKIKLLVLLITIWSPTSYHTS